MKARVADPSAHVPESDINHAHPEAPENLNWQVYDRCAVLTRIPG